MTNLFMYLTAMSAVSLHSLITNINTVSKSNKPHIVIKTMDTNWSYSDNLTVISPYCRGQKQSPINIETSKVIVNVNLRLGLTAYDKPIRGLIINQFPTFQIRPSGYKWSLPNAIISNSSFSSYSLDDSYVLHNIHFHWSPDNYLTSVNKSEHQIDGISYPLEIHIVHTNTKYNSFDEAMLKRDGILIMVVMVVPSKSELYLMDRVIDQLENITIYGSQVPIIEDSTWRMFLPMDTSRFFRYSGSLTLPPCYESVQWIIFEEKLRLGFRQMSRLQGFEFKSSHTGTGETINWSHQTRPIQNATQIQTIYSLADYNYCYIMVWPNYGRCSEILPRLYLGNMMTAKSKRELTHLGISDLLTIETAPLELKELPDCIKQYLFICAMDHPCQDIISDFEKSFNFIHEALNDPDRRVLVHCRAGVSRSASLVIAYVMKAKNIPFQAAHDFTQNAREIIQPNDGFIEQLKLYQKMKCNIDLSNRDYRYVCLMSLLFEHRLPQSTKTTLITEPYITRVDPSIFRISSGHERMRLISSLVNDKKNTEHILNVYFAKLKPNFLSDLYLPENAYRCANCRTIVFYEINVLQPLSAEFQITVNTNTNEDSHYVEDCGNIYIEPQPWTRYMNRGGSGIIKCFKCQYKLGDYNWKCEDSCVTPLRTCLEHVMLRDVSMVKISKKKVDAPSL